MSGLARLGAAAGEFLAPIFRVAFRVWLEVMAEPRKVIRETEDEEADARTDALLAGAARMREEDGGSAGPHPSSFDHA